MSPVSDSAFRAAAQALLSPLMVKAIEEEAGKESVEPEAVQELLDRDHKVSMAEQVRQVFRAWVEATGKTAGTKLDSNRENLITKSIKSHGLEVTLDAVRGVALSDFHMGRDPKTEGKRYDGLHLVLRNAEQIERFAALSVAVRTPPDPQESPAEKAEAAENMRTCLAQLFLDTLHTDYGTKPGAWKTQCTHDVDSVMSIALSALPIFTPPHIPEIKHTDPCGAMVHKGIAVLQFDDSTLDHHSTQWSAMVYADREMAKRFAGDSEFDLCVRGESRSAVAFKFEMLVDAHAKSVKRRAA